MAKRDNRKKTEASLEVGDRLPFGELAMLFGFISREDLSLALRDQVLKDQKIGKLLINQGSITKDQARKILKCQKRDGPIEGYVLIQRIGSGGMGTVYKSLQKSLNRTVAIKILNREAAGNDIQRRRFIQEAHLLAQLQHPNLIQCFDIGESNELVYLVMEFVEGRNAREVLNHEGSYEEENALTLLSQCLEGMIHYHEKSIIHRDIKPENLLLSEEGVMKITDLGLSKQLTNDLFLTRVGKTVGTPYYISPELAKGQASIDIRSDLYSLGATFYHLMCGVPPFDGDSSAEILTKHVRETAKKPSSWNESLSKSVDHILLRMLEKAPKKRYQDPEEALADVQSVLESGKLSSEITR
ncbi:MAG: serine/threonine-protein kinase, partial [Planctomycetota bacterium]|nr:serine/threonine-protein kinase [Planctomycetota bacterium]